MILSVNNIRFAYNSHPVLDAVSFSLEKGRMLAIMGVNGAGKSTLLKCLNRILKPQAGSVLLGEKELSHLPRKAIARLMGYVPQQQTQPKLTVFEAVLLGRRPHLGLTVNEADYEVVEQTLERMALASMALRPVSDLSGGEIQKVMIARALAQSPQVLLLDEPTSSLDLKNKISVMGQIRTVVNHQRLMAVIAIHDLNLAVRFADHFLFIKDQRVHGLCSRDDLNADLIEAVYGLAVRVEEVAGHTVIVPL